MPLSWRVLLLDQDVHHMFDEIPQRGKLTNSEKR
jgi:hypothetical protein